MADYPSIDKPWLKYYDREFAEAEIPSASIYQVAWERNKNNLDKIALDVRLESAGFESVATLTYGELFAGIDAAAQSLVAMGIGKGDIVPLILPNIPEARILIYAINKVGAVSYPISPMLGSAQLAHALSPCTSKAAFCFAGFLPKFMDILTSCGANQLIVVGQLMTPMPDASISGTLLQDAATNLPTIPWNGFLAVGAQRDALSNAQPNAQSDADDIAVIVGTSGTTGTPKGVCLTNRNLNAAAWSNMVGAGIDGTVLDSLMPSIAYGVTIMHLEMVKSAMTFLVPEPLTAGFPAALAKLRPENFAGGSIHFMNLLESGFVNGEELPFFSNLVCGGSTLPTYVEEGLNGCSADYIENGVDHSLVVRQGFSLTENAAVGTYSKWGAYRFGSVGIPLPFNTVAIFKEGTEEELPCGQEGEICITGPSVMSGYLDNEEETANIIKVHSDGRRWVHTKDIGYVDEDGHLFHVGRIKNVFMHLGHNVHPEKVTDFICSLDGVLNCAVIGYEHPEEQCVPVAFVEPNIDGGDFRELVDEIMKKCYEFLSEPSVPYAIVLVDALPVNIGGKVDIPLIKRVAGIDLTKSPDIPEFVSFLEPIASTANTEVNG